MRNGIVTTITAAALSVAGLAIAAPAHADTHYPAGMSVQIEEADRAVGALRVSYVERDNRRLFVELNNGAAYSLRPCRYEDGSGQLACYWNAGGRGNGIGRSFVAISGQYLYVTRRTVGTMSLVGAR